MVPWTKELNFLRSDGAVPGSNHTKKFIIQSTNTRDLVETSAPIGPQKCNSPPLEEIMTERQTDRRSNWRTNKRTDGRTERDKQANQSIEQLPTQYHLQQISPTFLVTPLIEIL